jgi:hypothetical protein
MKGVESPEQPAIEISSYGPDSVAIRGLSGKDAEKAQGMVRKGMFWMTVIDGKAHFVPRFEPLPDPVHDSEMLPFWQKAKAVQMHFSFYEMEPLGEHSSPSFFISGLGAFDYTEGNYAKHAERLLSFGFDVLRSKRDNDGKYWELWYLPGAWSAKGDLKRAIEGCCSERACTQKIIDFLQHSRIAFGSLDVCVQKLAMSNPD